MADLTGDDRGDGATPSRATEERRVAALADQVGGGEGPGGVGIDQGDVGGAAGVELPAGGVESAEACRLDRLSWMSRIS